jgi:hypothetical protein
MKPTVLRSKPRDARLRDLIRQARLAAARAEALARAS